MILFPIFKTNKKWCPITTFHSTERCKRTLSSRFAVRNATNFPANLDSTYIHERLCPTGWRGQKEYRPEIMSFILTHIWKHMQHWDTHLCVECTNARMHIRSPSQQETHVSTMSKYFAVYVTDFYIHFSFEWYELPFPVQKNGDFRSNFQQRLMQSFVFFLWPVQQVTRPATTVKSELKVYQQKCFQ